MSQTAAGVGTASSRRAAPPTQGAPEAAAGAAITTAAVVGPALAVEWTALPAAAQEATVRHVIDTVGVMVAGAWTHAALAAADALGARDGNVPVAGRSVPATALDAAFLGGVAAHGLEFDDGYRQGSVHPGACIIPAAVAAGYGKAATGPAFLAAVAAGYEATAVTSRAFHPAIRQRGFHPTGAIGAFGAVVASGRLLGLDSAALSGAFGTAASSAGGLFAFLSGGGDVKSMHAGSAARNGLFAALLAQRGVLGPPTVLETRDGFAQAFAGAEPAAAPAHPAAAPDGWAITDCYVKPYPCCRHLHTAVDLVIGLMNDHAVDDRDILDIEIDTYRVAAAHAVAGWADPPSAQLSFPFVVATAARRGTVALSDFEPSRLAEPATAALAAKVRVRADEELDRGYPTGRPARVTVTTATESWTATAQEARGTGNRPLSDDELFDKFHGLVVPVLGVPASRRLLAELLALPASVDIRPAFEAATRTTQNLPVRILW